MTTMQNLNKKLYQLIITSLNGDQLSSMPYQKSLFELVQRGIGGFIIFGGRKDEVQAFVSRLQSTSEFPLFIASDIERGAGQQIEGASHLPSQMAIAAALNRNKNEDLEILRKAVQAVADEAIDIGINMPLIPVLDVNSNQDNPIICTRAFSDRPEEVAGYGNAYIKILEDSGLISCAKHFPGHGDTDIDSHISLPVISKSLHDLKEIDIFPFKEAIKAGVSSIMAAHLTVPAIDTLPASLSKKIISGLLRREMGYEGLIMTDALNMHALQEIERVPTRCIDAGIDIILHPADADMVVEELNGSLSSGEITEEMVDNAFARIMNYKSCIVREKRPSPDYKSHAELFEMVSDRSITLVKDTPATLPIGNVQDISLIYTWDRNKHDLSVLKNCFPQSCSIEDYGNRTCHETVVFALFTSIAAWQGSSGIHHEDVGIIRKLIKDAGGSIVISFGSPYVLRNFSEADMLIAAYDTSGQAQSSVIKCLQGEREFRGSLPVDLCLP